MRRRWICPADPHRNTSTKHRRRRNREAPRSPTTVAVPPVTAFVDPRPRRRRAPSCAQAVVRGAPERMTAKDETQSLVPVLSSRLLSANEASVSDGPPLGCGGGSQASEQGERFGGSRAGVGGVLGSPGPRRPAGSIGHALGHERHVSRVRVPRAQARSGDPTPGAHDLPTCAPSALTDAPSFRESSVHAGSRRRRWRDPDSNRGHHDLQSLRPSGRAARNPWKQAVLRVGLRALNFAICAGFQAVF